jgi:hypothetical protein
MDMECTDVFNVGGISLSYIKYALYSMCVGIVRSSFQLLDAYSYAQDARFCSMQNHALYLVASRSLRHATTCVTRLAVVAAHYSAMLTQLSLLTTNCIAGDTSAVAAARHT